MPENTPHPVYAYGIQGMVSVGFGETDRIYDMMVFAHNGRDSE